MSNHVSCLIIVLTGVFNDAESATRLIGSRAGCAAATNTVSRWHGYRGVQHAVLVFFLISPERSKRCGTGRNEGVS